MHARIEQYISPGYANVGVFYYTLGNIRPSYRSTYRSIQLLAIAASTDIKSHGVESLLSNFIDSVNQLSSVSCKVYK